MAINTRSLADIPKKKMSMRARITLGSWEYVLQNVIQHYLNENYCPKFSSEVNLRDTVPPFRV